MIETRLARLDDSNMVLSGIGVMSCNYTTVSNLMNCHSESQSQCLFHCSGPNCDRLTLTLTIIQAVTPHPAFFIKVKRCVVSEYLANSPGL